MTANDSTAQTEATHSITVYRSTQVQPTPDSGHEIAHGEVTSFDSEPVASVLRPVFRSGGLCLPIAAWVQMMDAISALPQAGGVLEPLPGYRIIIQPLTTSAPPAQTTR
jgi:hypothetical protein